MFFSLTSLSLTFSCFQRLLFSAKLTYIIGWNIFSDTDLQLNVVSLYGWTIIIFQIHFQFSFCHLLAFVLLAFVHIFCLVTHDNHQYLNIFAEVDQFISCTFYILFSLNLYQHINCAPYSTSHSQGSKIIISLLRKQL